LRWAVRKPGAFSLHVFRSICFALWVSSLSATRRRPASGCFLGFPPGLSEEGGSAALSTTSATRSPLACSLPASRSWKWPLGWATAFVPAEPRSTTRRAGSTLTRPESGARSPWANSPRSSSGSRRLADQHRGPSPPEPCGLLRRSAVQKTWRKDGGGPRTRSIEPQTAGLSRRRSRVRVPSLA
jgi:hypothetical protein